MDGKRWAILKISEDLFRQLLKLPADVRFDALSSQLYWDEGCVAIRIEGSGLPFTQTYDAPPVASAVRDEQTKELVGWKGIDALAPAAAKPPTPTERLQAILDRSTPEMRADAAVAPDCVADALAKEIDLSKATLKEMDYLSPALTDTTRDLMWLVPGSGGRFVVMAVRIPAGQWVPGEMVRATVEGRAVLIPPAELVYYTPPDAPHVAREGQ